MILAQPLVFHFPEYCPGRHLIGMRPSAECAAGNTAGRRRILRLRGRKYKNLSSRRTKCQQRWHRISRNVAVKKSSNLSNSFERVLEDEGLYRGEANIKTN